MKYKKYPSYKDSGIDWLCKIPSEWNITKVKHKFLLGRGRVISLEELEEEGEYPVYSSQTKNNGILGYINSYDFDCKQITWTTDGANAGTVFLREGKHNCTNVCGTLLPIKKNENLEYLTYTLGYATTFYKRPDTNGAKIMNGEMSEIFLTFPPVEEQQQIANFLDKATSKIDTLIEKQTKQIELLKEKRQAVISHAVTKGINPNVPMKDSGVEWLGEIPEHWEVKKLKYISTVNDESLSENYSEDFEINYIDIGSVTTGSINKYENMMYSTAPSRAKRIVKNGDILVSTVRTYLKAIAPISLKEDNFIVSTGFAVIRSKNKIISDFMKYGLLSNYFIDLVEASSVGISYPAINASDLITFKIAIPPLQEQQQIANYLDEKTSKIDILIEKSNKSIELLKEKRTALISAAVTGKIDVRKEV